MIRSFKDKETEWLFHRERVARIPTTMQRVALRKLRMIDAATDLNDLRVPPGNRLEALDRDRKGSYSIRINDQFRICFEWHNGDAYQVEIVDYH